LLADASDDHVDLWHISFDVWSLALPTFIDGSVAKAMILPGAIVPSRALAPKVS
jgi:hypothetical protein